MYLGLLAMLPAGCGGGGGDSSPAATYAISGTVSGAVLADVRVSVAGAATASAVTDTSGRYSIGGLADGSYSVSAALAGYTFTPASRSVTISGANVVDQNFVATGPAGVATGIDFLPASYSSADQLRLSLVEKAGSLYFTDSSDTALKRVALSDGTVTALARRMGNPESVAVQGQNAFWVDGSKLNKTSLDGAVTTLLATAQRSTVHTAQLVVDSSDVFWVSGDMQAALQKVGQSGGTPTVLATMTRPVVALASDASYIYWEEFFSEPVSPGCECGSTIKRVPKAGGSVTVLVDGLFNGGLPAPPPNQLPGSWLPTGGLAVDGDRVFFGVSSTDGYRVMAVSVSTGVITTLATVPAGAGALEGGFQGLTTSGGQLYWIDDTALTLNALPTSGGTPVVLASGLVSAINRQALQRLVVQRGYVYWTEPGAFAGGCLTMGGGSIRRVPLTGGPVATIVGALDAPVALATDGVDLVWTELWRVARAPLAGGPALTLASGISTDLARIAVGQDKIVILDGDLIKQMATGGGTVEKLAAAHGTSIGDLSVRNQDIATDGVNVYWTVDNQTTGPTVRKVPLGGGTVETLSVSTAFTYPQDCYWRIAVTGGFVYWSAGSTQFPVGCSILKVPVGGGSTTTLVDVGYLRDFTVDGTDVYYSELSSPIPYLRKVSVNGGAVSTVATNVVPWVLASDDANLYWVDPSAGIGTVPKRGGTASFLVPYPLETDVFLATEALLVTPDAAYWTESVSGDIYTTGPAPR